MAIDAAAMSLTRTTSTSSERTVRLTAMTGWWVAMSSSSRRECLGASMMSASQR